MNSSEAESRILGACKQAGMRITRCLRMVISLMLKADEPLNLNTLSNNPSLSTDFDGSTVYRVLTRLEHCGIARKIGSHGRSAHYVLCSPYQSHREYLICENCGEVNILKIHCPVENLEATISADTGYQNLYHELLFYGSCKRCSEAK